LLRKFKHRLSISGVTDKRLICHRAHEFGFNLLTREKLAADPAVASREARDDAQAAASAELADGGRVSKNSATASQTK
jgi:hypothetical protein